MKTRKNGMLAMSLGEEGRKQIKGHNLDYYLSEMRRQYGKNHWLNLKDAMTNGLPKWIHLSLAGSPPITTANGFMYANTKLITGDK